MAKILITGALGHIGSKLMEKVYYKLNSSNISFIDDLSAHKYCSLKYAKGNLLISRFQDLTVEELKEYDVVIHLAAITNAAASMLDPEEVETTNLIDTREFIDKCAEADVKFVFPSSTSVYGVAADIVKEDDDSMINPQSPYAHCKWQIEEYLRIHTIEYVILRLGTIYGTSAGMRFHTAINKFCFDAIYLNKVVVWKENYLMKRPYLDVNVAVDSLLLAATTDRLDNNTYNIVSSNIALETIVDRIKSKCPHYIDIEFVDTPLLNQYSYEVSSDKIKLIWSYNFKPRPMSEAIAGTMQWLGAK